MRRVVSLACAALLLRTALTLPTAASAATALLRQREAIDEMEAYIADLEASWQATGQQLDAAIEHVGRQARRLDVAQRAVAQLLADEVADIEIPRLIELRAIADGRWPS